MIAKGILGLIGIFIDLSRHVESVVLIEKK